MTVARASRHSGMLSCWRAFGVWLVGWWSKPGELLGEAQTRRAAAQQP